MQLFSNIFTSTATNMTLTQLVLSLTTSLGLGLVLAMVYRYRSQYTREFILTLLVLPTLIALIVLLINGNLGTGVAVAGAFGLVRFRSAAGSSKDLLAVFLAMVVGLAVGMGYLTLAIAVTILLSFVLIVFEHSPVSKVNEENRHILLTVDKTFDYTDLFEKGFGSACKRVELASVHYKCKKEHLVLEYVVTLDKAVTDKKVMDTLFQTHPIDLVLGRRIPKQKRL